ncbi:MAG: hypothetical protein FWG61_06290 [Firmicutes bacterium]|nr:hypothetical protein [Bacillota bacterium]
MDSIIIIIVIFWLISRFVSSSNKKKQSAQQQNRQNTMPQQQSSQAAQQQQPIIDIQKRLREALEAAEQKQTTQMVLQTKQTAENDNDIPPYRRLPAETEKPLERNKHHIDEIEEERCENAEQVRQERRKQELRERFGAAKQNKGIAINATIPVKQPTVTSQNLSALNLDQTTYDKAAMSINNESSKSILVQGIIMAEILGPPRAKKRHTHIF